MKTFARMLRRIGSRMIEIILVFLFLPGKSILRARISEVARFPQPHFFLRELNSEDSPSHNNLHGSGFIAFETMI
jgi:hypothetical protein